MYRVKGSWVDVPLSLSLLSAQSSGAVEEILDRENKRIADSLASKVTRLKSVSSGLFHLHLALEWDQREGRVLKGLNVFPVLLSHGSGHLCEDQVTPGSDFWWCQGCWQRLLVLLGDRRCPVCLPWPHPAPSVLTSWPWTLIEMLRTRTGTWMAW